MLYTDFTEKLLGLQDLKVTKVEKNEKAVCIYAEMLKKRIIEAVANQQNKERQLLNISVLTFYPNY